MRRLVLTLAVAVAVVGTAFVSATREARAVVIVDFVGACVVGCVGQTTATLTLVDGSSINSGTLDNSAFISFSYSSSNVMFDVPGDADLVSFTSTGNGFFDLTYNVMGVAGDGMFNTMMGNFVMTFITPTATFQDSGSEFSLTERQVPVPEPGTFALLLCGLVLAGLMLRVRPRAAPQRFAAA